MAIIKREKVLEADTKLGEDELLETYEQVTVKKKKVVVPEHCPVCLTGADVSYKNIYVLKRFTSRRGRIIPRSRTGLCAKHQRKVAKEIKVARILALLPFVGEDE